MSKVTHFRQRMLIAATFLVPRALGSVRYVSRHKYRNRTDRLLRPLVPLVPDRGMLSPLLDNVSESIDSIDNSSEAFDSEPNEQILVLDPKSNQSAKVYPDEIEAIDNRAHKYLKKRKFCFQNHDSGNSGELARAKLNKFEDRFIIWIDWKLNLRSILFTIIPALFKSTVYFVAPVAFVIKGTAGLCTHWNGKGIDDYLYDATLIYVGFAVVAFFSILIFVRMSGDGNKWNRVAALSFAAVSAALMVGGGCMLTNGILHSVNDTYSSSSALTASGSIFICIAVVVWILCLYGTDPDKKWKFCSGKK